MSARIVLAAGALALALPAAAQSTTLVSANPLGFSGNLPSGSPDMSADGRWVVFESQADDLVPGDTNAEVDVFVRDTPSGVTTRGSLGAGSTVHARDRSRDPGFAAPNAIGLTGGRQFLIEP